MTFGRKLDCVSTAQKREALAKRIAETVAAHGWDVHTAPDGSRRLHVALKGPLGRAASVTLDGASRGGALVARWFLEDPRAPFPQAFRETACGSLFNYLKTDPHTVEFSETAFLHRIDAALRCLA